MEDSDHANTSAQRFARFFKSYGVALGTILAAVPVLTTQLEVFPAFAAVRGITTATASILSLLAIGFLFGMRRWIGTQVFPRNRSLTSKQMGRRNFLLLGVPGLLIVASVLAMLSYLSVVQVSITEAALQQSFRADDDERSLFDVLKTDDSAEGFLFGEPADSMRITAEAKSVRLLNIIAGGLWGWLLADDRSRTIQTITAEATSRTMADTAFLVVPNRLWLLFNYVAMFLAAVTAFVWMGLVEYLREELGLSDRKLLENPYGVRQKLDFKEPRSEVVDTVTEKGDVLQVSVYFSVEYDPDHEEADLQPTGPYCSDHEQEILYLWPSKEEGREGQFVWMCAFGTKEDKSPKKHELFLPYDRFDAAKAAAVAARREVDLLKSAKG